MREATSRWTRGWTVDDPIRLGYQYVSAAGARWEPGLRPYFEYRDLGLVAASGGELGAKHIRARWADRSDWHRHDLDFQVFVVLEGSITLDTEDGRTQTLTRGGVGYQPPLWRHREAVSEDYEAIEITAPAAATIVPDDAAAAGANGKPFYVDEQPGDWVARGLRTFFEYRYLPTGKETDGRIGLQILRAVSEPPPEGTGWHYHSSSQIFIVMTGWVDIAVEGHGRTRMQPGDAMCIPGGVTHTVGAISRDYMIVEMFVPDEYETTPMEAPAEFA